MNTRSWTESERTEETRNVLGTTGSKKQQVTMQWYGFGKGGYPPKTRIARFSLGNWGEFAFLPKTLPFYLWTIVSQFGPIPDALVFAHFQFSLGFLRRPCFLPDGRTSFSPSVQKPSLCQRFTWQNSVFPRLLRSYQTLNSISLFSPSGWYPMPWDF